MLAITTDTDAAQEEGWLANGLLKDPLHVCGLGKTWCRVSSLELCGTSHPPQLT